MSARAKTIDQRAEAAAAAAAADEQYLRQIKLFLSADTFNGPRCPSRKSSDDAPSSCSPNPAHKTKLSSARGPDETLLLLLLLLLPLQVVACT